MIPTALPAAPANATGDGGAFLFFGGNGSAGAVPPPTPAFPAYIRLVSTAVCALIMAVGVVGNVLVPLVILRARDLRNSTNIFLVNLSAADLLVLLVCAPAALVEVHSPPEVWVLGAAMCKTVPFVEMTVAHASVLTILAISFERYYAICEPLRAGYVCTKARAAALCGLAWLLAALLTSPVLQISHFAYYEYSDGSRVPACHTRVDTAESVLFFVASIALFFALPLLLLVALYAAIARRLRAAPAAPAAVPAGPAAASRSPPSRPPAPARAPALSRRPSAADVAAAGRVAGAAAAGAARARRQVVVMLGAVVACFFVCLLPFRALTLWIVTVPQESVQSLGFECYFNILSFCRAMTYLNSAMNPILYNLMSSKFRAGFLRLCCGEGRRGRRAGGARLTASSWLSRASSRRALACPRPPARPVEEEEAAAALRPRDAAPERPRALCAAARDGKAAEIYV